MMKVRTHRVMPAFAIVLLISGCGSGGSDAPELGAVSGTVTLNGQPLAGATVTFQPEQGRASSGVTDASGRYQLQYTADTSGAKVGKHAVTITTGGTAAAEGGSDRSEQLPARYNVEST